MDDKLSGQLRNLYAESLLYLDRKQCRDGVTPDQRSVPKTAQLVPASDSLSDTTPSFEPLLASNSSFEDNLFNVVRRSRNRSLSCRRGYYGRGVAVGGSLRRTRMDSKRRQPPNRSRPPPATFAGVQYMTMVSPKLSLKEMNQYRSHEFGPLLQTKQKVIPGHSKQNLRMAYGFADLNKRPTSSSCGRFYLQSRNSMTPINTIKRAHSQSCQFPDSAKLSENINIFKQLTRGDSNTALLNSSEWVNLSLVCPDDNLNFKFRLRNTTPMLVAMIAIAQRLGVVKEHFPELVKLTMKDGDKEIKIKPTDNAKSLKLKSDAVLVCRTRQNDVPSQL